MQNYKSVSHTLLMLLLLLFLVSGCKWFLEPPATPTGLTVGDATSSSLTISWNISTNATGYELYRDTSSSGDFSYKVYDGSGTSYTDTAVTEDTTYYYKVLAKNADGESPLSSSVAGTASEFVETPTGLTVGDATSSSLTISWDASSEATGYELYHDTTSGGDFSNLLYDGIDTSYTDTDLIAETVYYYKVLAKTAEGSSSLSSEVSGTTLCYDTEAPTITEFTLTSNNPTAYEVITLTLQGTDNFEIDGWLYNESSVKPNPNEFPSGEWTSESYSLSPGYDEKTIYAWAKDACGNVSDSMSITVSYVEPGTTIWEKKIDGSGGDDVAYSVTFPWFTLYPGDPTPIDIDNIYVVGYTESGGNRDWWIKKFQSDGTEITDGWNKTLGGGGDDVAYSVAVRPTNPFSVFVVGQSSGADWWLRKYQPDGTEITDGWNKTLDGGGIDAAYSVVVDGSGNCYIAGYGESLVDTTGDDWWINLFQSGGEANTDWAEHWFDGGSNANDQAKSVIIDGGIYFAGYFNNGSDFDWWIKRFQPWGDEITVGWDKKIDSGSEVDDFANGMAIDSSDNLYVVGNAGGDWWIKKFQSDGTEITDGWNQRFDGGGIDAAHSVTIDGYGNVYVVGNAGGDWWIKKFQADGTEITDGWDKQIGGGNDAIAYDVAVDQSGDNIYVVGYGTNLVNGSGKDWWIKKFLDDRP